MDALLAGIGWFFGFCGFGVFLLCFCNGDVLAAGIADRLRRGRR